ncbi:MAG: hypothetical protein E7677_01555 [Ruminococcaceae bacterium]|nr:hypothetical protein [Oscillospiraceae bacterium]
MKKFTAVFLMLSTIILSFASCNINGRDDVDTKETRDEFDIAETEAISLGKEVDSVVLVTGEGEEIICNDVDDFYEIFNKVNFTYYKDGKKYSFVTETKMHDNSKTFTNMNIYYFENSEFLEIKSKKEGDDAVALIESYTYHDDLSNDKSGAYSIANFARYVYKEEEAFGGYESGKNGYVLYSSNEYPLIPNSGTELADMQIRSMYPRNIINMVPLFLCYQPVEENDQVYDFDAFVTREYKLYENYIVFKQTSPFLMLNNVWSGQDHAILYAALSNADCAITQEAYCNVKTGEIEFIKVYGDTLWHVPEYMNKKLEINMLIYIHDIEKSEGEKKANKLIEYIKSKTD